MAKDNGHLTKQDQRQLNREANRMNRRIYQDKHDAKQSGMFLPSIEARVAKQGAARLRFFPGQVKDPMSRITPKW